MSLVAVKTSSDDDASGDLTGQLHPPMASNTEWPRVTTVPVENQELLKIEREEAEAKTRRNNRGESLEHPGKWTQQMVAEWWTRTLQRLAVKNKWVQKGQRAQIPAPPEITGKQLTRWPQARLEQACGARGGARHGRYGDTPRAADMAKCLFQRLRFLMQQSGKRKQQLAKARSKAVLRPADAAADAGGHRTPRQTVPRRPSRQHHMLDRSSNNRGLASAPATVDTGGAIGMMSGDDALDRILSAPHQQRRRQPVDRARDTRGVAGSEQRQVLVGGSSRTRRNYFQSAAQTVLQRSRA